MFGTRKRKDFHRFPHRKGALTHGRRALIPALAAADVPAARPVRRLLHGNGQSVITGPAEASAASKLSVPALALQSSWSTMAAGDKGELAYTRSQCDAARYPPSLARLQTSPAPDHACVRRLGSYLAHRGEAQLAPDRCAAAAAAELAGSGSSGGSRGRSSCSAQLAAEASGSSATVGPRSHARR